jgi:hypothetical protein
MTQHVSALVEAIQFTNLKLLNCDSCMDPYITSIEMCL